MVKNIERQRAKKIYKKEQAEDPPGVRHVITSIAFILEIFVGSVPITSGGL